MANDTPFSQRRMPAVDGAILDLHLHARAQLKKVKPRRVVGKVHRGTENASLYLILSFACDRSAHHLDRACRAMDTVVRALDALRDERQISHELHQDLRTFAEQIVAALDQLAQTPRSQWADLALPPRPRPKPRLWLVP